MSIATNNEAIIAMKYIKIEFKNYVIIKYNNKKDESD